MKKKFFLVGAIAISGLSAFLISCSKDDNKKDAIGCTCTERYNGDVDVYSYSLKEMKSEYDASNCSQLARNVNLYDYAGDAQVACSELY